VFECEGDEVSECECLSASVSDIVRVSEKQELSVATMFVNGSG
jgi:hypothetical protein